MSSDKKYSHFLTEHMPLPPMLITVTDENGNENMSYHVFKGFKLETYVKYLWRFESNKFSVVPSPFSTEVYVYEKCTQKLVETHSGTLIKNQ